MCRPLPASIDSIAAFDSDLFYANCAHVCNTINPANALPKAMSSVKTVRFKVGAQLARTIEVGRCALARL